MNNNSAESVDQTTSGQTLATPVASLLQWIDHRFAGHGADWALYQQLITCTQAVHAEYSRCASYADALALARTAAPSDKCPWLFQKLVETERTLSGILTLFRVSPVPMHDHPASHGAQLLLDGECRIRQYEPMQSFSDANRVVLLERKTDELLTRGDIAAYTPWLLNIHQFQPVTSRCHLFTFSVKPDTGIGRSWFFGINPLDDGCIRYYRRLPTDPAHLPAYGHNGRSFLIDPRAAT
jgi:hypothetical protein